jgi:hypothetical protein
MSEIIIRRHSPSGIAGGSRHILEADEEHKVRTEEGRDRLATRLGRILA